MFFYVKKTSDLLIPSFLMSDVSKLVRLLSKNKQMSVLLVFLSDLPNCSFFCKKRAIRSENQWVNSQPWFFRKEMSLCNTKKVFFARKNVFSVKDYFYTLCQTDLSFCWILSKSCQHYFVTLHKTIFFYIPEYYFSNDQMWSKPKG